MSLFSRILGRKSDDKAIARPLWHRIVEIAREREWYADCGVADTVPGRFDAITLVLSLVILRMEREEALLPPSARLTELFVEDMDGQLRQSGVGDLVVGKHMGKLMSVLGGRMGALRDALPSGEDAVSQVIERNVSLIEGSDPKLAAQRAIALDWQLAEMSSEDLLEARFER
ncbi:MAG: hypothetical protein KDE55_18930 [Novosphingobium sp.]|nr:hypothetical protein [Novosphingobium sp.]